MKLTEFSLRNPLVVAAVDRGVACSVCSPTPRWASRSRPNVNFPQVVVTTIYPGADPETVEANVTKPIEDAIATLPEHRHQRPDLDLLLRRLDRHRPVHHRRQSGPGLGRRRARRERRAQPSCRPMSTRRRSARSTSTPSAWPRWSCPGPQPLTDMQDLAENSSSSSSTRCRALARRHPLGRSPARCTSRSTSSALRGARPVDQQRRQRAAGRSSSKFRPARSPRARATSACTSTRWPTGSQQLGDLVADPDTERARCYLRDVADDRGHDQEAPGDRARGRPGRHGAGHRQAAPSANTITRRRRRQAARWPAASRSCRRARSSTWSSTRSTLYHEVVQHGSQRAGRSGALHRADPAAVPAHLAQHADRAGVDPGLAAHDAGR